MDQEITINPDSDIILAASSGVDYKNSDYVELQRNSPTSLSNSLELETIIEDILQVHDDVKTVIEGFYNPIALFSERLCQHSS